ncbi:MAG TPA: PEP/pyruvate-binding domain-containing protein, partial [Marmoricola sp.]|nr:PEP/pyruvate-binding domain-containing protein [Marmoricola sp.]
MSANPSRFVFDFAEGNKDQKDLLGGKGANLAEMTNLGLPVPPGFIITTEACRGYFEQGGPPEGLVDEVLHHLAGVEQVLGKSLGNPDDPLLLAVRSGAKFSMPGMMETVLNVGLNDQTVSGLAAVTKDPRFAWDSYRRLLQMFGATVMDVDSSIFAAALVEQRRQQGVCTDQELTTPSLQQLVATYQGLIRQHAGRDFPQDPKEQLLQAVWAVFDSWNTDRARLYRRQEQIPEDLGTAVNVLAMVFGNLGADSGTGVAFTRDPATGNPGVYGDYLENAQGEDVVAGIRNTRPLTDLELIDKDSYDQLLAIMSILETHYRDMCDIEFTIERGRLWMLQTRVGKRTPEAAFRIAVQLLDEGLIDPWLKTLSFWDGD